MNIFQSHRRAGAFTLVELLCVIAIIGILAALLLPVLSRGESRAKRAVCGSNLGQLGIAFQIFMHDHAGKFPMQVPMTDGGSQEFVQNGYAVGGEFYFSFRHFQVLSNEDVTPRILICPADTRLPAVSLGALQNGNISYFVGVNADYAKPSSILAGDRNIANLSRQTPTIVRDGAGNQLRWTKDLHQFKGNVLFADGHVEEWNNNNLAASPNSSSATADFFLPSIKADQLQPALGGTSASYNAPPNSSGLSVNYSSTPGDNNSASSEYQSSHPNNSALNHRAAARQTQNERFETPNSADIAKIISTTTNAQSITTTGDLTEGLSTFDQHVVKTLRPILEWTYFLLLLLLLLFLALELWRRERKRKKRQAALKR